MVPVGNFQVRCHWKTVADGKDPDGKDAQKTTWKSDLVPGGVVRISGISHLYDSGGEYQWSLLSVDPVPASFSAPNNSAPLTPSGLVDLVPPFPNGVPPADPVTHRTTAATRTTPPMLPSNPNAVASTQPMPNPPAHAPGAPPAESQPNTAVPSPAHSTASASADFQPAAPCQQILPVKPPPSATETTAAPAPLALSPQSKTILAIIKKSLHFAGTAPQQGFKIGKLKRNWIGMTPTKQ